MKGAAEGLRLVICGSNLFSIKGMRGVRKCHLFWSWEREFEVFPSPLCVALGVHGSPALFSGLRAVEQPARCWSPAASRAAAVSEVPALVLGRSRGLGPADTRCFSTSSASGSRGACTGTFFLQSSWRYPEPQFLGFCAVQPLSCMPRELPALSSGGDFLLL